MTHLVLFEQKQVRRAWNEADQKWYFAIVDVVAVLTDSVDAGAYWRKLKERLKKEGNETVTNCHAFKMTAADGKQRLTDVADAEQLLRLIQSVPSPKAEPFKRWLAKVGYERLQEIENPELAAQRMREIYRQKGYSEGIWGRFPNYRGSGQLNTRRASRADRSSAGRAGSRGRRAGSPGDSRPAYFHWHFRWANRCLPWQSVQYVSLAVPARNAAWRAAGILSSG